MVTKFTRSCFILGVAGFLGFTSTVFALSPDAKKIESIVGSHASTTDGVVKVTWSRNDVKVNVDGMPLKPFAGLTSWAAFASTKHGATMLMGDTVVFQDEVSPAIDAAFASGLEVTALHNHFFYDEPKVYFMHIGGHGDQEKLATGVKNVWDAIKKLRNSRPVPASSFPGKAPEIGNIDKSIVEKVLSAEASEIEGMVKISFARQGKMHDTVIGGPMGLTTWAAFSGTNSYAAIDGDFIMTKDEVQSVLREMRKVNFHIVALHNHMMGEEPNFFFVHFWAKGSAQDLSQRFKQVLSVQERRSQS